MFKFLVMYLNFNDNIKALYLNEFTFFCYLLKEIEKTKILT